jgi:hypothetical protein
MLVGRFYMLVRLKVSVAICSMGAERKRSPSRMCSERSRYGDGCRFKAVRLTASAPEMDHAGFAERKTLIHARVTLGDREINAVDAAIRGPAYFTAPAHLDNSQTRVPLRLPPGHGCRPIGPLNRRVSIRALVRTPASKASDIFSSLGKFQHAAALRVPCRLNLDPRVHVAMVEDIGSLFQLTRRAGPQSASSVGYGESRRLLRRFPIGCSNHQESPSKLTSRAELHASRMRLRPW